MMVLQLRNLSAKIIVFGHIRTVSYANCFTKSPVQMIKFGRSESVSFASLSVIGMGRPKSGSFDGNSPGFRLEWSPGRAALYSTAQSEPLSHKPSRSPISFMPPKYGLQARTAQPTITTTTTTATSPDVTNIRSKIRNVRIIDTIQKAQELLKELTSEPLSEYFHAWDTETVNWVPGEESPLGSAKVICASLYAGDDLGRVWIDNLDAAEGVLEVLKPYFENNAYKKVWHNYSFDRAALFNHGIDVRGLGGDTMHMARLYDTSLESYALEYVGKHLKCSQSVKIGMKERFGKPKPLKNGQTSKRDIVLPSADELQRNPEYIEDWIDYSTLDAELTFRVRALLEMLLRQMPLVCDTNHSRGMFSNIKNMYELYVKYVRPFGELLTDMERVGFYVNQDHLVMIREQAENDQAAMRNEFLEWVIQVTGSPDMKFMNVESPKQLQQLLFGPWKSKKKGVEAIPPQKEFDVDNVDGYLEPGKDKPKRSRPILIQGLNISPIEYTAKGLPSVGTPVLRKLAGSPARDPPKFGLAKDEIGEEGCLALDKLIESTACATLLDSFIIPLSTLPDENGRIHASLNINTETGRLSCRRPNLQNQPALEKDRYGIRKAFTCEPGNTLIVADYGQLELRLLAHITACKSMIDAFEKGGDFHSRTALSMYPHIQEAVQKGEVLLERVKTAQDADHVESSTEIPLIKDKYANERRKAKILNFSIAYGKTAVGLSKDFGTSLEEAQETVNAWYRERQEVRAWQETVRDFARNEGYVPTIGGRRRHLPDINSREYYKKGHAERAAINSPLQGSAADVVMMAMIKIWKNARLKRLGWNMVLQVHDEIIMEGPMESSEEASTIMRDLMENPLPEKLLVDLKVDLRAADNWYDAK